MAVTKTPERRPPQASQQPAPRPPQPTQRPAEEDKKASFRKPPEEEERRKQEEDRRKQDKEHHPDAPKKTERDTQARREDLDKEGETSEVPPENQIHSSALPLEGDPELAWQNYAPQAIQNLYPLLRPGVDYAYGRTAIDQPASMLHWDEKFAPADEAAIEAEARRLQGADPYANYETKQGLHGGSIAEDREILDPDVAQSEVNPKRNTGEKVLSQPYQPQPEAFERERAADGGNPNDERPAR